MQMNDDDDDDELDEIESVISHLASSSVMSWACHILLALRLADLMTPDKPKSQRLAVTSAQVSLSHFSFKMTAFSYQCYLEENYLFAFEG